jgi:hypothetical protein
VFRLASAPAADAYIKTFASKHEWLDSFIRPLSVKQEGGREEGASKEQVHAKQQRTLQRTIRNVYRNYLSMKRCSAALPDCSRTCSCIMWSVLYSLVAVNGAA